MSLINLIVTIAGGTGGAATVVRLPLPAASECAAGAHCASLSHNSRD